MRGAETIEGKRKKGKGEGRKAGCGKKGRIERKKPTTRALVL